MIDVVKVIAFAACAMLLAGCGEVGSDMSAKLMAEKAVKARLKDPDSAVFSDLRVSRAPINLESDAGPRAQNMATCGYVNARNSFGGMVGDVRFVVTQRANYDLGTFSHIRTEIEDRAESLATPTSNATGEPATLFEELFWNKHCSYGGHNRTYTGKRW